MFGRWTRRHTQQEVVEANEITGARCKARDHRELPRTPWPSPATPQAPALRGLARMRLATSWRFWLLVIAQKGHDLPPQCECSRANTDIAVHVEEITVWYPEPLAGALQRQDALGEGDRFNPLESDQRSANVITFHRQPQNL